MSKTFDGMRIDEQQAWWLEEAKQALKLFEMKDTSIEWLAYTHNAVFSVRHHGNKYVLKLSLPEQSSQIKDEYRLLSVLSKANIAVSQALHFISNERFAAILLHYLDGESPDPNEITTAEMHKIGQFLARFHNTEIDDSIDRASLDWDGLFSESGIYYPGDENMIVFTDKQIAVMDVVAQKVKSAMDVLGNNDTEFGLIHGDLLLKNILFHENEVRALDFEYCGWGYYLYDLTPILWQLKPQARYAQLEQALWDGYTGIRPLIERHRDLLEIFIAGRQVASMRWIAANQQNPYVQGKVEGILAQRTAELSAFLETGILKRE